MARKRKLNLPLIEVVGISLILHVVALFVLGSYTLYTVLIDTDPELEAPPLAEKIEPQKLQHQVQLQKQQRKSQRQQQQIDIKQVAQMDLPEFDMNMPMVQSRVAVNTGAGAGGLGSGFEGGGIDLTKSAIDLLGVRDSGENVAIVLDTARSMLEQERGDVRGYNRVKQEIAAVIADLKPGTLFNIYAYDDNLETFSSKPVAATSANRTKASEWVKKFWNYDPKKKRFIKQGAEGFDNPPDMTGLPVMRQEVVIASGSRDEGNAVYKLKALPAINQKVGYGSSRMDLALLAAAEGGADVIFLITNGAPWVHIELNDRELKRWQREYNEWARNMLKDKKEYDAWLLAMEAHRKKERAFQEERKRKGLPPAVNDDGHVIDPPKPPRDVGWFPIERYYFRMPTDQFVKMVSERTRQLYRENNMPLPPLHVIGYSTSKREEDVLKAIQKGFRGGKLKRITPADLNESASGNRS
ncbi:MAG: hypothetical protein AAGF10_01975 [Verrucomicrobiota bacterium]